MLALAPEEIRKEELETRALVKRIEAIHEDIYKQYRLKGYVELEATEEVTGDDEPGVVGFRSELNVPGWPGFRKVPWWL
jgi:hypothetical protein